MNQTVKYVILGAGPTGLGAAYRLKELDEKSFIVLEKAAHVGGLAASFRDAAGFMWDIGGHVHFSHYNYFDKAIQRVMPEEQWTWLRREAWIWMQGRFIPYPLQNNIHHLPRSLQWDCLKGLFQARYGRRSHAPAHFEEWIDATFGAGIARHFMLPYNFKVWGFPAREMSFSWIGERVATADPWRALKRILSSNDETAWGPNATFRFPKKGGTGALWEAMGQWIGKDVVHLEREVVAIDARQKTLRLASGDSIHYEALLSTMPIDLLMGMIERIPPEKLSSIRSLGHSSSHIVGIGLKGQPSEALRTKSWMYFPEADCPFYRATVFSNYSPDHTPDPQRYWSLLTETSETPHKPVKPAELEEQTIQGLLNTKLIRDRADIVSLWSFTTPYGYPVPTLARECILADALPYLESFELYTRGRFGAWRYEVSNQDHSFMQGVEWANRMVLKEAEVTVFDPARVNAAGRR